MMISMFFSLSDFSSKIKDASFESKSSIFLHTQDASPASTSNAEVSFCFVKKFINYPLKWMVEIFQKEIIVIYLSLPTVERPTTWASWSNVKNYFSTLDIFFFFFCIPSPEDNFTLPKKAVSCITDVFLRFFPPCIFCRNVVFSV